MLPPPVAARTRDASKVPSSAGALLSLSQPLLLPSLPLSLPFLLLFLPVSGSSDSVVSPGSGVSGSMLLLGLVNSFAPLAERGPLFLRSRSQLFRSIISLERVHTSTILSPWGKSNGWRPIRFQPLHGPHQQSRRIKWSANCY